MAVRSELTKAVEADLEKRMNAVLAKAKQSVAGIDEKLELELSAARARISYVEDRVEADIKKRTNEIIIRMVTIFSGLFFHCARRACLRGLVCNPGCE